MDIIITIDVEASRYRGRPLPFSKMVYGKLGDKYFGISAIMDICDAYGIKATFFVDVYEYRYFGEEELEKVCESIKKRNHDVQLHTHPGWISDRTHMKDHTLAEQIKIIQEGKELLYKWIGEYPIAHRAGSYAANMDTLDALRINGIPIDSSYFLNYPTCNLRFSAVNQIFEQNEIIEIPVTLFTPLKLGRYKNYRSVDINSCTLSELKHAISEGYDNDLKVMILFLHSFSFVKRNRNKTSFYPDNYCKQKFDKLLDFIVKNDKIRFTTMKDFHKSYLKFPALFTGQDYVPHSGIRRTFLRACKDFRTSWKNQLFLLFALFCCIAFLLLIYKFILFLSA